MMTLGERIALARKRAKMTQQELADAVGVGAGSRVSEWEGDKSVPEGRYLLKMPEALGCDGHWLLTGSETRSPAGVQTLSEMLDEAIRLARKLEGGDGPGGGSGG